MRPRLLDLFCCAGGATRGYQMAGFHVTGIDIDPQPNYCGDEFIQANAIDVLDDPKFMAQFDAGHASPPCQDHSSLAFTRRRRGAGHDTGWLLPATIDRLQASGLPYVVENVDRADMPGAFTLCGRSFGIAKLKRHRQFLTNFPILVPPCACSSRVQAIGVYGDLSKNDRKITNSQDGYVRMRAGIETARTLLGCPWMEAHELTQAIPPVYTEFIGEQLIKHLTAGVAS